MPEFKKILFPVDLSDVSPRIFPFVLSLARRYDAEIHLLFVVRTLEYYATFYVPHPSLDKFDEEIVEAAKKQLMEFEKEHLQDYPKVQSLVLRGDPADEILEYAKVTDIDLVVIGTHGRKGLERIIFGSVAHQVVTKCPVPVLTVNPYLHT